MRVKAKFNVNRAKALFGEPDHPELCKQIVNQIPEKLLRNGRILDVGIGCGGIARAIVNRLVNELYVDWDDAILRVYGIDTNQALVNRARRLGIINTVCADFLEWDPQMKFDAVIGNPPYQKNKYSDFYVCFMQRAAELLKAGGYFSMIAPAKGSQPLSRAQKPLALLGWSRVEFGVESYFPNIGTVIANYVGVKGKESNTIIVELNGEQFDSPKGTVFPLDSHDRVAYSAIAKIFGSADKMPFLRQKTEPTGKYLYVSRLIGTWHPNRPKGGPYALKAFKSEAPEQNDGGFLTFNTDAEVDHAAWAVTRSLVMRFAINRCGKAAFIAPMFWGLMPNLLSCKDDDDTFVALGLTPEEVSYIKQWEYQTYK